MQITYLGIAGFKELMHSLIQNLSVQFNHLQNHMKQHELGQVL